MTSSAQHSTQEAGWTSYHIPAATREMCTTSPQWISLWRTPHECGHASASVIWHASMLIIRTSCAQSTNRCHNTARPLRRSCVQRSLCHQGYCARCGAPGVMLGDGKTSWGALCGKCATVHCRLIPPQKTHLRNIHKALKKNSSNSLLTRHSDNTDQVRERRLDRTDPGQRDRATDRSSGITRYANSRHQMTTASTKYARVPEHVLSLQPQRP
jgi:hypothetical protein